jgi:membrane-associated phospholipid phosphatase
MADVTLPALAAEQTKPGWWTRPLARVLLKPYWVLVRHPIKVPLFIGYVLAWLLTAQHSGVFYDRERLFPWLGVGMLILVAGTGWRRIVELVLYWIPFAFLWVAYDLVRGLVDNGRKIHVTEPIRFDKDMFFGHLPTTVLQDRLYVRHPIQTWEVITGVTYMTHFFLVYVTAAVLFVRSRDRFVRWMTALVLCTILGVLGYWLYPMAPPWMASDTYHLIPQVARPGTRGLLLLHLSWADRLWHHGANNSEMVNSVAAMPSLHAAYTMLFVWFFFKRVRRRWVKALLVLYPLVMAFTLIYGGEHYMVDILAGWLIAIVSVEFSDRFHDWRATRRVTRASPEPESSEVADPVPA